MRSEAPPLLPVFRSRHQADLLTALFLRPDREYTLAELARELDVPVTTLHRDLAYLLDADLVTARPVGRSRLLRANTRHRAADALAHLLTVTFGPHVVLADEFAAVPGLERLLVYGSWAARYAGEPGPPPHDIDVLVIGTTRRPDVYEAAERAERRLDIPVNPALATVQRWNAGDDPLIQQIRSSPFVPILPKTGEDAT
jgi:DNA-binding transcriptional ArsR family regulator